MVHVVQMLPEARRIDSSVFNVGHGGFNRVDVVDREKTGNPQPSGHRWYEAGHPVIAVDEVGLHARDDVVHDLSLKGQGELDVFLAVFGIDSIDVEKSPVFGQVHPVIRHFALDAGYFLL